MEIDEIKKLIKLAKEEGLSEIAYENKQFKVSINLSKNEFNNHYPVLSQVVTSSVDNSDKTVLNKVDTNPENGQKFHFITSPFVGTYYSSPAPDKPTFVKVGQKISKGTPLCILEAMKIMNEIESDVAGEIVEVLVENESVVEFAQPLYKIKIL